MQGFTKTLAIELGQFGVTANAVAPGFIVTDMTASTAERVGVSFEDFQKGAAARIPVRPGRPAGRRGPHYLLPGQRGRELRLRPGHLRGRRSPVLGGPVLDMNCEYAGHDPRAGPRLPGRTRPGRDAEAGLQQRPVRRGPGLGALPGGARRPGRVAHRCRPSSTPSSPQLARRATTPSATASAWAWPRRRSSPTATTSSRNAGCASSGRPRKSGASCSASPARAATWPRWPPGRSRTGDGWVVSGQKVWTSQAHSGQARPPGHPHRPRRAETPGPHLLRRGHDRRPASRSGRCASSPARPSSMRYS